MSGEQLGTLTSQDEIRTYLSQLIRFLTISCGLSVGDIYWKDIKYNKTIESSSCVFSLFLYSFKGFITFLLECVDLIHVSR